MLLYYHYHYYYIIITIIIMNTFAELVAWACLGAGTVILTWTIFTMGSPRWLPLSISAWMRRSIYISFMSF